jgi:hypothetical protein
MCRQGRPKWRRTRLHLSADTSEPHLIRTAYICISPQLLLLYGLFFTTLIPSFSRTYLGREFVQTHASSVLAF